MKKDIIFRLFRIAIVLIYLIAFSTVRADVKARYDEAFKYMESMPSFVVTELGSNTSKSNGLRQEHTFEIKNTASKKKDISFVIQNENTDFPYNYLHYSIVKDGVVIDSGVVDSNIIYSGVISDNEKSIYSIVFTMTSEDIYTLGGVSMSCEIAFV